MSSPVPILMYHSVSDRCSERFAPFAVRPSEFADQLALIKAGGFAAITVAELAACYAGRADLPARPVVLTFDDGFADFFNSALPALIEAGMPATVYVVAGLVGYTADWLAPLGEARRPLMGWADLAALRRHHIEIGAHSMTHPELDALSLDDCQNQVRRSKVLLEEGLSYSIQSFAYPFGFESRFVRKIVQEAGFSSACAVRYATSRPCDDPFRLPRQIIRRGLDPATFLRILRNEAPALPIAVDRVRSRAFASVRPLLRMVHA